MRGIDDRNLRADHAISFGSCCRRRKGVVVASDTLVVFTLSCVIIVAWALIYALNPWGWRFVGELGGGFLRQRRANTDEMWPSGGLPEPLQMSEIRASQAAKKLTVNVQRTGETLEFDLVQQQTRAVLNMLSGQSGTPLVIFPSDSTYVELAHAKMIRLWDTEEEIEYNLKGWPLVARSQAIKFAEAIERVVKAKKWSFDTFCTLSLSAVPTLYAYLLHFQKDVELVARDNFTFNFLPESFLTQDEKKRVLFLDGVVQTGGHIEQAWNDVKKAGHTPVGLFAVIRNDILPSGVAESEFLKNLFRDGNGACFMTASQILKYWKQQRSRTQAEGGLVRSKGN